MISLRSNTPSERGGFRSYAVIPPTPQSPCRPWEPFGDPLGIPWEPLGDPWGTPWGRPWGPLGDPLGTLGDPLGTSWGPIGDSLGITWRPSGTSWDLLVTPWRSLGDHLEVLLVTSDASWTFFGANLELQGTPRGSQRGSRRPLGVLLGSFWRLRKRLRSDLLHYAKTFKFTVMYCKIRSQGRLKP